MNQTIYNQLEFLTIADKMKSIQRQSLLVDGSRRSNRAEHSWHFALMAMTLFEHCAICSVNLDRVLKMSVVHDLVEIYAGDSPAQYICFANAPLRAAAFLPLRNGYIYAS